MNPSEEKPSNNLAILLILGSLLLTWIGGGVLLGLWADHRWHWTPWGTVIGSLLGLSGAGYSVFREVQRMEKR